MPVIVVPPLANGCYANYSVSVTGSGGLSSSAKTLWPVTNWGGNEWYQFGLDDQGHTIAWELFLSFGGTTIHAVYSVDFGSGFEHLAFADDAAYNGTDNYDSPSLTVYDIATTTPCGLLGVSLVSAGHPP